MTTGMFPRCSSLVFVLRDGVGGVKRVIKERVRAPMCLCCCDVRMTVVVRPIYVGLDGEKIFVLIIVESELI